MFDTIRSTVEAFTKMRIGPWCALGDVLLVGEGNLSFAGSLLRLPQAGVTHMTATVFEKNKDLSEETINNAQAIKRCGGEILSAVDATKLEQALKPYAFDTIIFQFPNVGSRDAKHGHNPNHVMIRKFLRSAAGYLKPDGKVMITAVDTPHYQDTFQFDDAAAFAGYETSESYPFDPSLFPGYSHTNTNDDDSALDEHNRFATWVFRLKR
jgi:hypothetical protein